MSIEGRLTITLRPDAEGSGRAEIASSRPIGLARGFVGRRPEQVVRELPLLFSVCGIAQAAASVSACAQAIDLAEPAPTARARRLLVLAESLREHLLRLAWEPTGRDAPEIRPIMAFVPALRAALAPDQELFALGAAPRADAEKAREQVAALDGLLRDLVFGEAPGAWLGRVEPAAFERWAREQTTPAAGLAARLLRKGWAESGAHATAFLPALSDDRLFERLTGAEGEAFAARPDWDGRLYETTSLARQRGQPLVAALLAERGSGLLTRLAARLVEVARLPGEMHALLAPDEPAGQAAEGTLGGGRGLAQVEAARGRLAHGVVVEGDRVADYRILAPTEWNFHPEGGVAQSLAGLDGSDDNGLRERAGLLIEAVDPCVGYELVVL